MTSLKKFLLVGFLILLSLIIAVISVILSNRRNESGETTGPPLSYIGQVPEGPEFFSPWSVETITFKFDQPINPDTIFARSTPSRQIKIKYDSTMPREFGLIALDGWEVDTYYTINIRNVKSTTGGEITEPISTTIIRRFSPENYPDAVHEDF